MRRWMILLLFFAMLAPVGQSLAQGRYVIAQHSKNMEMGLSLGAAASMVYPDQAAGVDLSPKIGIRAALEMALVWQDDYALQIEMGDELKRPLFAKFDSNGDRGIKHWQGKLFFARSYFFFGQHDLSPPSLFAPQPLHFSRQLGVVASA